MWKLFIKKCSVLLVRDVSGITPSSVWNIRLMKGLFPKRLELTKLIALLEPENIRLISDVIESCGGKKLARHVTLYRFWKSVWLFRMEFLVQSTGGHELWPDVLKMDPNFYITSQAVLWTMVTRQTFSSSTEAFNKVAFVRASFCTSNWGTCPGDQRKWKNPRFKNQWHLTKTKYVCRWSYSVYKGWAFGQSLLIQSFKWFWYLLRSENKFGLEA